MLKYEWIKIFAYLLRCEQWLFLVVERSLVGQKRRKNRSYLYPPSRPENWCSYTISESNYWFQFIYKAGVINDLLGQPTVSAGSEDLFCFGRCLKVGKDVPVRTDNMWEYIWMTVVGLVDQLATTWTHLLICCFSWNFSKDSFLSDLWKHKTGVINDPLGQPTVPWSLPAGTVVGLVDQQKPNWNKHPM